MPSGMRKNPESTPALEYEIVEIQPARVEPEKIDPSMHPVGRGSERGPGNMREGYRHPGCAVHALDVGNSARF